jgi:hypothetical protein
MADAKINELIETQWQGVPAVVLHSPPGAGKTGVAERLAVLCMVHMRERVMVVTQTNVQSFDLARRLALGFPRHQFYLLTRRELVIPTSVLNCSNIIVVHRSQDLPAGPLVVIGNAKKWSWFDDDRCQFELQIIDEAYQLPAFQHLQIAGLARRHVLIGDPGQIDPVVQVEIERWRCDAAGPHVPAPDALLERFPQIVQMTLPVSRRLVQDTVDFVQPAFYPSMNFVAMHRSRSVEYGISGIAPMDTPLDAVTEGESLVMVQLPEMAAGEVDLHLADEMVWTINRLLDRNATVVDENGRTPVTASMIGVACAHVAQVNAVRERLGKRLQDVFVETANRFQGIERAFMFVQHPLSGRVDATEFHLDAGRLCVLLTRHRVGCWVFGRDGITSQLRRYAPVGDRSLGISDDAEFVGWRANTELMKILARRGRIYSVPGRSGRSAA